MSSSEPPAITVNKDGLADPNFDGYFNDKEYPQSMDEEDPYSYVPPQMPQTEGEVKSAVEDLTQSSEFRAWRVGNNSIVASKSFLIHGNLLGDQHQCTRTNFRLPKC
jgi:hypothetical protein